MVAKSLATARRTGETEGSVGEGRGLKERGRGKGCQRSIAQEEGCQTQEQSH